MSSSFQIPPDFTARMRELHHDGTNWAMIGQVRPNQKIQINLENGRPVFAISAGSSDSMMELCIQAIARTATRSLGSGNASSSDTIRGIDSAINTTRLHINDLKTRLQSEFGEMTRGKFLKVRALGESISELLLLRSSLTSAKVGISNLQTTYLSEPTTAERLATELEEIDTLIATVNQTLQELEVERRRVDPVGILQNIDNHLQTSLENEEGDDFVMINEREIRETEEFFAYLDRLERLPSGFVEEEEEEETLPSPASPPDNSTSIPSDKELRNIKPETLEDLPEE